MLPLASSCIALYGFGLVGIIALFIIGLAVCERLPRRRR